MKNKRFKIYGQSILLAGLLLLECSAHGQEFNAGIFGGVTASQVDGDTYGGFNKLGITAGAFVNRYIDWDIYWQLELKYVMRGVYEGPGANDNFLYKSSYHYLEFPISVHYLINEKFQIELGTSPEVLLFVRYWDQDGLIDASSYPENRRIGLSVFGGIHYWFTAATSVGIRYTYSAIPFREPQEWNNAQYRGYFHNVLCLTVAYKFKH
jgi:hypothetical protein